MSETPVTQAAIFTALVDALIPGDDLFPPASQTGVQGWALDKLREQHGTAAVDTICDALGGAAFLDMGASGGAAAVAVFEQSQPALFDFVRRAVYFGYYMSPLVVRAVRELGFVYNDAPQPEGYDMGAFDPAQHLQKTPRGHYVPTDAVERVDLSGLSL